MLLYFTKLDLINRWWLSEKKSDDECSIKKSISLPKDTFGLLKTKSVPPNIVTSLEAVGLAEENFHIRSIVDRFELPVSVREVLLGFDCEHIPLSENHLGLCWTSKC